MRFFQRIRSRFQTYISMKFSRQIFIKKQSKFCKLLVHKLHKPDFIGLVHSSPLLPSGTRRLFSFWGFFVNLQLKYEYKLQHSRGSDKLWNIWVNCSVKEILFIKWNYIIVQDFLPFFLKTHFNFETGNERPENLFQVSFSSAEKTSNCCCNYQ